MEKKENWKVNPQGEVEMERHFGSGFVIRFILIHPGNIKRIEIKNIIRATSMELGEALENVKRYKQKRANFAAPDLNEIRLLDSLIIRIDNAFMDTLLPKEKK